MKDTIFKIFLLITFHFFSFGLVLAETSYSDPPALREAKKSYSQKKYDTAIKQFTSYSEKNPGDGTPFLYMGYIYESRKDFPKSISMFRRAVEGNLSKSQKKTTLLKLALYYNYYQEFDLAYVYSNRYLKMNPNNKEVLKIRDKAEANRGKSPSRYSYQTQPQNTDSSNSPKTLPKKTKQEYEEILAKDPKNEEALWELALIAFSEKKYNKAERLMTSLVDLHPNKPSYSYKLGVTRIRLEKYKEAVSVFQETKKHISSDDKKMIYYLFLNEGIALYKLNRLKEAEVSLRRAYRENSSLPPLIVLTRVLHDSSQFAECIQVSEQVLEKESGDMETRMYRALCKYNSKEKDAGPLLALEKELRATYPKAKSIPDTFHPALVKLARDYTNSEKYSLAEEYYEAIENTHGNTREYLFYRGKALYYSNQPAKAIVYLEKVERSTAAIYLTAKSYAKLGNQAKTEKNLKIAGDSKSEYWELALEEEDFSEMRKKPDFLKFLKNKGKVEKPISEVDSNPVP